MYNPKLCGESFILEISSLSIFGLWEENYTEHAPVQELITNHHALNMLHLL